MTRNGTFVDSKTIKTKHGVADEVGGWSQAVNAVYAAWMVIQDVHVQCTLSQLYPQQQYQW